MYMFAGNNSIRANFCKITLCKQVTFNTVNCTHVHVLSNVNITEKVCMKLLLYVLQH